MYNEVDAELVSLFSNSSRQIQVRKGRVSIRYVFMISK